MLRTNPFGYACRVPETVLARIACFPVSRNRVQESFVLVFVFAIRCHSAAVTDGLEDFLKIPTLSTGQTAACSAVLSGIKDDYGHARVAYFTGIVENKASCKDDTGGCKGVKFE